VESGADKERQKYAKLLSEIPISSCTSGLGWQGVGFYGALTCLSCDMLEPDFQKEVLEYVEYSRKKMVANAKADRYKSTMGDTYYWGSNMGLLNNATLLIKLSHIHPDPMLVGSIDYSECESIAKEQLNYVLGKNPTGYCFVAGYGISCPYNPHHRPSQVQEKAYKGMIVGGANSNKEDPYAKATMQGVAPAKCYADNVQSYSCNEVTIYWNSPLVYMLSNYVK
jgi:endoglucanase